MTISIILVIAFILDAIFKDPLIIPHPVVLMGNFITYGEKFFLKISKKYKYAEIITGAILSLILIIISFFIPFIILRIFYNINYYIGLLIEIFLCFQILAYGSLKKAGIEIYSSLVSENIEDSRQKVSYIVGRDTKNLNEKGIIKATIETISENTSDGIVAPLFFMVIGGAPLGLAYKAINTLDSMIGYKNDKYKNFGMVAAKIDDIANIIPARLTGILYIIAAMISGYNYKLAYKIFQRDKRNHTSPNSGYPEAASAGILGIQLGGSNYYSNKLVEKPYIGDDIKNTEPDDILKIITLMSIVSIIALFLMVTARLLISIMISNV